MDRALFQRVPVQLWTMIFDILTDPQNLENLCLASPHHFGQILKPQKTTFLFLKVTEALLDSRLNFLSKSDILKCRNVCKSWRNAIDTAIPNSSCFRRHNSRHPNHDTDYCWMKSSKKFDSVPSVQRFIGNRNSDEFKNCCLFLAKSINFIDVLNVNAALTAGTCEGLKEILKLHGQDIWHFQFTMLNCGTYAWRAYPMLVELLELLPNLRTLEVFLFMHRYQVCEKTCKRLFQAKPLPKLTTLKTLKLECVPEVMKFYEIIRTS